MRSNEPIAHAAMGNVLFPFTVSSAPLVESWHLGGQSPMSTMTAALHAWFRK